MNIQYVVVGGPAYRSPRDDNGDDALKTEVFVLEVNPRSSRTIPFISKVTGVPMVRLAVKAMLGKTLKELGYQGGLWKRGNLVGVKAPVFSMSKLSGVDTYLGPEMKSTGEVMGIDREFGPAVAKALIAAGLTVSRGDSILLSIADRDKPDAVQMIRDLVEAGCGLFATEGTAALITGLGLPAQPVTKLLGRGHPNVLDVIADGTVDAVINTVTGDRDALQDGFHIRRAAVDTRIPCFTSLDTARAAVESMLGSGIPYSVKPLKAYLEG
jgi:carbamoyl-phosphate synthase large subunit